MVNTPVGGTDKKSGIDQYIRNLGRKISKNIATRGSHLKAIMHQRRFLASVRSVCLCPVADPKILKREAEDNLSALSSFIANTCTHNEIRAFYTEKRFF